MPQTSWLCITTPYDAGRISALKAGPNKACRKSACTRTDGGLSCLRNCAPAGPRNRANGIAMLNTCNKPSAHRAPGSLQHLLLTSYSHVATGMWLLFGLSTEPSNFSQGPAESWDLTSPFAMLAEHPLQNFQSSAALEAMLSHKALVYPSDLHPRQ